MAWRGMSWYVESYSITCFKALSWAIVPFTRGVADVSWRSCSHVPDPFTSRVPFTCMSRSHAQLLFTLGRDSKQRACEFIDHCSGIDRYLDIHSYCVLSVDQAFVIANICKYQL